MSLIYFLAGIVLVGIVIYLKKNTGRMKWNSRKTNLNLNNLPKWFQIFIGSILIFCFIYFLPWRGWYNNFFPSKEWRNYNSMPENQKIEIGEWETIHKGEVKYMFIEKKSRYLFEGDPLYQFEFDRSNLDIVNADYIRIGSDRLHSPINWTPGRPIYINGFAYGTKETIPEGREPDLIPSIAYGCYRVTYNGPSKHIKMFIKKI